MSAIDRLIWDRLSAYGMPQHHVAGILGNLFQESGFDPAVENKIGAFGLGQWLGPRRKALAAYAAEQGRDITDPLLQTDFLVHELNTTESKAAKALQNARTPGEAATIFRAAFERPGKAEANDPRRIKAAQSIFERFSPISSASAEEFSPADYGLVPDNGPMPGADEERSMIDRMTAEEQGFNPADYGLVPDDSPLPDTPKGGHRQMQAWPDAPTGGLGDFLSGMGSSLARQASGITQGLQGAGQAMGMSENPAFRDMPLLSPDKLSLLGATLKRNTETGELGEFVGDLAPYLAMNPALSVAYAAASTPGGAGDRATAAGWAALGAGLGYGVGRSIGGFTPSRGAQALMGEGVYPTVGQGIEQDTLGRAIRRAEEATTSMPIAGATTRSARARSAMQWMNAVLGRAEAPEIGVTTGGAHGYDGVANLKQGFRDAYGSALDGNFVPLSDGATSPVFGNRGSSLLQQLDLMISQNPSLLEESKTIVKNIVAQRLKAVFPNVDAGMVPANVLKSVADDLGSEGASLLKAEGQEALKGRALLDADSAISEHINQYLPDDVKGLIAQIDDKYANFKRIERATAMARNPDGIFNPEELKNAVRLYDTSRDKSRFASGSALLQDLARAGKAVIPETLGESGTAPRALMANVMKGGAAEAATGMLGGLPTYATLAGLMYGGSREPIQRALLGGYAWQRPASEWMTQWGPRFGSLAGYELGQ